ncbi:protein phosphatase 2C domain-containing protein [Pseudotenacibaculum haliotis]|uniref:Protein phosphatase 2C domain-containing protein n=1 Tax=Pseudotenacibaculum haliotis TaxID=1862138 RepID=A0ABW5LRV4_9FLAO
MKIYTTLHIGDFHTNHCEDFFINEPIGTHKKLIAVLDGCTMGTESVFASILYGKILRNIAKKKYYAEFINKNNPNLKTELKEVVRQLIYEIRIIKNHLGLEVNELLSTLIIGIIDITSTSAEILAIGDGLISIDGKLTEYEQDDKPDYLGYHLSEDFNTWYDAQKQTISVSSFQDLSVCTDGIFTFRNLEDSSKQKEETEIIDFLLNDAQGSEFDNFLDRKIKILKDKWRHVVTDDLAIIRIKKEA